MKIHSLAFDKIHDLVGDKHYRRLTKIEKKQHTIKMSQDLWDVRRKGKLLIAEATMPFSSAANIIKTERARIRKETKSEKYGAIDETLLISLLRFINYKTGITALDRDIKKLSKSQLHQAANILFGQFIEEELPEYYVDYPYLKIYSNALSPTKRIETSEDVIIENLEKEKISTIVHEYFNLLNNEQWLAANNLLNTKLRENNYLNQEAGDFFPGITHNFTKWIYRIVVTDINLDSNISAHGKILYTEQTILKWSPAFINQIFKGKIKDLDSVFEHLKAFFKELRQLTEHSIDDIPLRTFFSLEYMNKVNSLLHRDDRKLRKIFPNQHLYNIARCKNIKFEKEGSDWKISHVDDLFVDQVQEFL